MKCKVINHFNAYFKKVREADGIQNINIEESLNLDKNI